MALSLATIAADPPSRDTSMCETAPVAAARWKGQPSEFRKPVKYRTGVSTLSVEDQQRLAGEYLPLARSLARPYQRRYPRWPAEFESAACLGLVEAARHYEAMLGPFPAYARYRIAGALAKTVRGLSRANAPIPGDRRPASIERPVGTEFDDMEAFEALLANLPHRHAVACRLRYAHGQAKPAIAATMGISATEVSRLHSASVRLLRRRKAARQS